MDLHNKEVGNITKRWATSFISKRWAWVLIQRGGHVTLYNESTWSWATSLLSSAFSSSALCSLLVKSCQNVKNTFVSNVLRIAVPICEKKIGM
jgi:hypothetical protein